MASEIQPGEAPRRLGVGQVVLTPSGAVPVPPAQMRQLYRFSDPALSELGLEDLLNELLLRVRDVLRVDTVAILLIDEERRELVARAAKGIEEEVEAGVRIPIGLGFAGRIAAERLPIFIADVDHADVLNPILREKRIRSMLGVPLIVEGELIGVLHVGSLTPREFGQRELTVLQLAAARAAPAIERARLYDALEHEHQVAMVLQRSLLPKRTIDVAGADVSARYLPARDEVGGDWYDVIELPGGLLGIAIGDVVGHGLKAASLMGQLRTALRAYALQGTAPGRTLEMVDRYVQNLGESVMATSAYAVFDTDTGRLRYATAGHLPPVVISSDGARLVELAPAAPLGAFPYGSCPDYELTIASGEILMLYTDGLVERRGTSLTAGMDELVSAVAGARSAAEACERALERLVPERGLSDDVAIVALQGTPIPAELELKLSADPRVLAEVRRTLRRWLYDRGAGAEDMSEVTIAVNEACTNAIEHAYSPAPAAFELEARTDDGYLTVVVRDAGTWRSPRGRHRGRGLKIIEAAMDEVELNRSPTGTELVMRRRLRAT
jgi:anti-sigma regulatory factor (Ser/Thr protein kinase)/putative methionine-R-sulfoxide reductase with GAF domain